MRRGNLGRLCRWRKRTKRLHFRDRQPPWSEGPETKSVRFGHGDFRVHDLFDGPLSNHGMLLSAGCNIFVFRGTCRASTRRYL